ncbi:hypothetical protein VCR9J2_60088 [Vibrio crassostreae]|nr:hypothetical protein VCR9J2_60088 [Vibrio crassostreae]
MGLYEANGCYYTQLCVNLTNQLISNIVKTDLARYQR